MPPGLGSPIWFGCLCPYGVDCEILYPLARKLDQWTYCLQNRVPGRHPFASGLFRVCFGTVVAILGEPRTKSEHSQLGICEYFGACETIRLPRFSKIYFLQKLTVLIFIFQSSFCAPLRSCFNPGVQFLISNDGRLSLRQCIRGAKGLPCYWHKHFFSL